MNKNENSSNRPPDKIGQTHFQNFAWDPHINFNIYRDGYVSRSGLPDQQKCLSSTIDENFKEKHIYII